MPNFRIVTKYQIGNNLCLFVMTASLTAYARWFGYGITRFLPGLFYDWQSRKNLSCVSVNYPIPHSSQNFVPFYISIDRACKRTKNEGFWSHEKLENTRRAPNWLFGPKPNPKREIIFVCVGVGKVEHLRSFAPVLDTMTYLMAERVQMLENTHTTHSPHTQMQRTLSFFFFFERTQVVLILLFSLFIDVLFTRTFIKHTFQPLFN